MSWTNAFKDAKGDWNIAECSAAPAVVAGVAMWLWKAAHHPEVPDLTSFGVGLGALITALAAAQRLRGDSDIDRQRRDEHGNS